MEWDKLWTINKKIIDPVQRVCVERERETERERKRERERARAWHSQPPQPTEPKQIIVQNPDTFSLIILRLISIYLCVHRIICIMTLYMLCMWKYTNNPYIKYYLLPLLVLEVIQEYHSNAYLREKVRTIGCAAVHGHFQRKHVRLQMYMYII